jgi:hypothetical protein
MARNAPVPKGAGAFLFALGAERKSGVVHVAMSGAEKQ